MRHRSRRSGLIVFVVTLFLFAWPANAQVTDSAPLAPADTSSPRETLNSFLTSVETGLALELEATLTYLASDRLYSTEVEKRLAARSDIHFERALETLDLSGLPPGFRSFLAVEQVIRLSEILSRIDLPESKEIPDNDMMNTTGKTRWIIPNTPIEISLVEEGPRAGEYLFSAHTVARMGQIHQRAAKLPYKPGSNQRYVEAIRPYTTVSNLYDVYRSSTLGLGIIPPRWMLNMPDGLKKRLLGLTIWQWIGLMLYGLVGIFVVWSFRHGFRKLGGAEQWRAFWTGVILASLIGFTVPYAAHIHISGAVFYVLGTGSVALLYLVAAWSALIGSGAIAETIVSMQKLRVGGIDSQLVRLSSRLIGLILSIALLIEGADELGFPAYSVLTGLGIGGLAVAFAARETLANLLGSIVIMIEKPFRVGHWIKIEDIGGIVEYVGFRSTRIRTFDDSLISIPNSVVVNSAVDNLGVRDRQRQLFSVQLNYDTPNDKLDRFIQRIRQDIKDNPITDPENAYVFLNSLGENGLDVLLDFHLRTANYASELQERERILRNILLVAEELGVELAFPTRSLNFNPEIIADLRKQFGGSDVSNITQGS